MRAERSRLINRHYKVRHEQAGKNYCRVCRDCRHHILFFLYPFRNHLLVEKKNQTDLSKIKYCTKSPKGSEELLSKIGLCESQHKWGTTKIQNTKGIPTREIITNFIKGCFEISPEGFLGRQWRNGAFCKWMQLEEKIRCRFIVRGRVLLQQR